MSIKTILLSIGIILAIIGISQLINNTGSDDVSAVYRVVSGIFLVIGSILIIISIFLKEKKKR